MRLLVLSFVLASACSTLPDDADGGVFLDIQGILAPPVDLAPADVSSYGICVSRCEARHRCGVIDNDANAICQADCTSRRAAMDALDKEADLRCSMAIAERASVWLCWQKACNEIISCLGRSRGPCTPDGGW